MKFSLFKSFAITTKLTCDEVKKSLKDNIEPNEMLRPNYFGTISYKPYQGTIYGDDFAIKRITSSGNIFLPVISGKITRGFSGTEIHITMRLPVFVKFFMFIGFPISGLLGLLFATNSKIFEDGILVLS